MDRNTEKHCLPELNAHLPPGAQFLQMSGVGEPIKSLEHAHALWDSLDGLGVDRRGLIVALGGGTITDLAGFAAATYLRGVACWPIPTSLLAMVDASIGGKTGINFRGLKNRIGTFTMPEGVSIHPGFLETLPEREWRSGLAEHIKHMLIHAEGSLDGVERLQPHGTDWSRLEHSLALSVRIKSEIVQRDTKETEGIREHLNFGHTAGHALESWALETGQDVRHGEAIAWGMQVSLKMSEMHANCPNLGTGACDQVIALIQKVVPLPIQAPNAQVLWEYMLADKKNQSGAVHEVLLDGIGQPLSGVEIDFGAFESATAQLG
jgi:3-dehydroquinate synthase